MPFVLRPPGPTERMTRYRSQFEYDTYQADPVNIIPADDVYGYARFEWNLDTQGGSLPREAAVGTFYCTQTLNRGDFLKRVCDNSWWRVMGNTGPRYAIVWVDNKDSFIIHIAGFGPGFSRSGGFNSTDTT